MDISSTDSSGSSPAEHRPVVHRPAEQRPVEQRPVEQRPVEQRPVGHRPVEQRPVRAPSNSSSSSSSSKSSVSSAQAPPSGFVKRADSPDSFDERSEGRGAIAGVRSINAPSVNAPCANFNFEASAPGTFLPLAARVLGRTIMCDEARNERLGRTLRVTQRELKVVGGNNVQTRIEVIDNYFPTAPIIFSVKHSHGNLWARQMVVHKNLFLASILAGVADPPLEIPADAKKMFENTENFAHMHSYMERVLPHIKYPDATSQGLRLYWWRAVENGATVLQNDATGRLIVIPSRDKRLTGAADTMLKCLSVMRNLAFLSATRNQKNPQQVPPNMPGTTFLTVDPQYPSKESAAQSAQQLGDPNRLLSPDEIREAVQSWALDQQISPWRTQLVVKTRGLKKSQVTMYRYSIDVDPCNPKALSIQVHANEPLSRELQAFPVCMVALPIEGEPTLQTVYLRFIQGVWFLKKLFDFHYESEAWTESKKRAVHEVRTQSVMPRATYTRIDHAYGISPSYPLRQYSPNVRQLGPPDAYFNSRLSNTPKPHTAGGAYGGGFSGIPMGAYPTPQTFSPPPESISRYISNTNDHHIRSTSSRPRRYQCPPIPGLHYPSNGNDLTGYAGLHKPSMGFSGDRYQEF